MHDWKKTLHYNKHLRLTPSESPMLTKMVFTITIINVLKLIIGGVLCNALIFAITLRRNQKLQRVVIKSELIFTIKTNHF